MSKKDKKKKSAESLEAQARMHEKLYGSDSREVDEYRRQAREIFEKHRINLNGDKIGEKELKLFEKRLKEHAEGKRKMKDELAFYRVLQAIHAGKTIDPSDEAEVKNYEMLERLGYVKDEKLTGNGRKLLKRIGESR